MEPAILKQLALGVVPPGLIATALFAVLWFRKPRDGGAGPTSRLRLALTPLAIAAVYVICHQFVFSRTTFPLRDSTAWFAVIAAALGLIGSVVAAMGKAGPRALLFLLGAAFAGWASSRLLIANWSPGERAIQLGGFAVVGAVASLAAAAAANTPGPRRGPLPVFTLMVWVAAASQLLVLGFFSLKLSQVVGLVAAGVGGAWVIAFWRRNLELGHAGVGVVTLLTLTGVYHGTLYGGADKPYLLAGLAAASPLVWLAAAHLLPLRSRPIIRGLIETGLTAAPTVAAIAIAVLTKEPAEY